MLWTKNGAAPRRDVRKVYQRNVPEPRLSDDLAGRVLARLGIDRVERSADGLARLYRAWCHAVPWDNVQKRIAVARGDARLPGGEPAELFRNLLAHGTGGTCWPSAGALHALLRAVGFDARRGVGTMMYDRIGSKVPNHATTIVRIGAEEWLVDSSILNEVPVPLRRERTLVPHPMHPTSAEPHADGLWLVDWQAHNRDERATCLIWDDDATHERYLEGYEASRERGFSHKLTFHRGYPDGFLTIVGVRVWKDRTGALTVTEVRDRVRALIDAGVSEDAARRLPPDEEPAG